MKRTIKLPANVYLRSYLRKCGVRFDTNVIDTVCSRGLGISFLVTLVLAALLWFGHCSGLNLFFSGNSFWIMLFLLCAYLGFYLLRLCWCLKKRKKMRSDRIPVVCEAYAVVLYDETKFFNLGSGRWQRSAILYKETGSLKPRFFSGAVRRGFCYDFCPDQVVRIFLDRVNPRFYTVDDQSATAFTRVKKNYSTSRTVGEVFSTSAQNDIASGK